MAGAGVAVRAGMEAAAVGVDAPGEADVGAVVVGEDAAGVVLVDLELGAGGLAVEVLDVGRRPGVRRVGEGTEGAHPPSVILNMRDGQVGRRATQSEDLGDDRLLQELVGLALPPGGELLGQLGPLARKDGDREEAGVARPRLADGERRDGDALGHLHDGEQRVEPEQVPRGDGDAQDGPRRLGGARRRAGARPRRRRR